MTGQTTPERIIYQKRAQLQQALDRLYEERAATAGVPPDVRQELGARILQFESVLSDYDDKQRVELPQDELDWLHSQVQTTTTIEQQRRGRTSSTDKQAVPATATADVDRLEQLAKNLCRIAVELGFGAETKTPVNHDPEPV